MHVEDELKHTRTRAHTHRETHTHSLAHSYTHTRARAHTHTHTERQTPAHSHTHTHTVTYNRSLTRTHTHTHTHLQEVYELQGMPPVAKEEVQALVNVCNLYAVVCHPVLEQQLLQEQEGAFVKHVLPHLKRTRRAHSG